MSGNNIYKKVITGTKWASISEIVAKLISPITNIILARLLLPDSFGVVATVTMIMSFAEMFTDAGFHKYLIQHDFKDDKDKYNNANVAFITNMAISIILFLIIFIFREDLAVLVGNPGLGNVIAVSSIQLLLLSFSSIQTALYRRDFDFKTLFYVRIITICIPFIITIPLAIVGLNYWSLIIGTICMQLSNAIILTYKSKWKPSLFFDFKILNEMLSFSIWSLIESLFIWLTVWVDTFIIAIFYNQYYIGLYKTSVSMVNGIMSVITASTAPVLFSALSRLQDNNLEFNKMFFKTQKYISILIFPLGIGIFLFSDFATNILLGSQWKEASKIIGVWALTSSIMVVFGHYCSEVYRAKGKPKLSSLAQMLHLVILIPTCIISAKYSFWSLVYLRSWIRLQFVFVHLIIMKYFLHISIVDTLRNVFPSAVSSIAMGLFGYIIIQFSKSIFGNIISILICTILYFSLLRLFPSIKEELKNLTKIFKKIS